MKKLLLSACAVLLLSAVGLAHSGMKYCDLVVYKPAFKNFVAELHMGGHVRAERALLKDTNGKAMKFASEADALNYIAAQGWELVTAWHGRDGDTHFILKR